MTPPWMPADLFDQPDWMVRGRDAYDAMMAVNDCVDLLDMKDYDSMLAFRQPRIIAFMPFTRHEHDQDCNRA